jgi:hypothetical protein
MHKTPVKNYPLHKEWAANKLIGLLQNRVLLTPVEAGAACGLAKQTVYNKINEKNFPIPLVDFDGRKMVRISDLIEVVQNLHATVGDAIAKPSKVGRPTKEESIRHEAEKKGVAT